MPSKYLIVNADDFGQSPGVNRGIIEAHERGIVTSASLMVRWSAAPEAADYCRRNPHISPGLHVELGEWAFRDGSWIALYEVVPLEAEAVRQEVHNQLQTFRSLLGRNPLHLDSHQHVHLREPGRTVLRQLAAALNIPLRHDSPRIRYCGTFYGQTTEGSPLPESICPAALIEILQNTQDGWTELCCHPGRANDLNTMYGAEREIEVHTLCHPSVRQAVADARIILKSFGDLG